MFYKIINKIKIHIKLNNKYFTTKLINSDFKILIFFLKLNVIKNIKKNNKDIFTVYINNESSFKNFINMYKPGKPVKISYKNIVKLNKKKNKLFLINSNKGLITNLEAEKNKIGGFLILNILQ